MRAILRGTGWTASRFLPERGPLYVALITKTRSRAPAAALDA
jgi:hypothetical protein